MPCTKIFRARHWKLHGQECLYGCTGDSWEAVAVQEWLTGGAQPAPKNLSIMAIDQDNRIWYATESMLWHEITMPYWALGSGADYALGALAAGADARRAAEIACAHNVQCGMGIDTLSWEKP